LFGSSASGFSAPQGCLAVAPRDFLRRRVARQKTMAVFCVAGLHVKKRWPFSAPQGCTSRNGGPFSAPQGCMSRNGGPFSAPQARSSKNSDFFLRRRVARQKTVTFFCVGSSFVKKQ